MSKIEVSSLTVSLESMMLSCAIDAKEDRYIVVTDIPGAFLHADMDENMHMILEGTIAELIVKLDPSLYRKHIWYTQKGRPMLYVQLKRPYMECFGDYYQIHYRSGNSRSMDMTNVSPTKI